MRLFLNVVLVLVSFFACIVEDFYLVFLPPQRGAKIPITIRLQKPFHYDQEKALGIKRATALSRYVPLYTYVPNRTVESAGALQMFVEKIDSLHVQKTTGIRDFSGYLKDAYGLVIPEESVRKLLKYRDLRNFVNGVLTLEESILQGKIVEDLQPMVGKKTFEVLYPKPSGIVVFPADEMITLEVSRLALHGKVQQLFWQVDKDIRDAVLLVAFAGLRPNLIYDVEENERRIAEIMERYPSTVIPYRAGHVLVPFGHILTESDLLLLSAYREEVKKDLLGKVAWSLIAILLTALFYVQALEKIIKEEWRKDPPYPLFLSLLIITVLLLKTCLWLTPMPLFVLPFGALPLMLVLLQSDKIWATWTTLTAAMLVNLFSGCSLSALFFFVFTGVAAVMVSFRIRRRIHILLVSLAIGGMNSALFLCFFPDWNVIFPPGSGTLTAIVHHALDGDFMRDLGWAFIGGVAAAPLALLLLPFLEMTWHTVSTFRLSRYADLQHPLLKELLTKTPGTYQHTMTVAYLAQCVGEAIGANTLLLRIGAYYHDIGKVANPKFYSENQSGGKNPHDDLDPLESAGIIIDHVVNGEKIGKGMNLPQVVLDFICQHHGTQTVEFFYNKAAKSSRGKNVRKKEFQYSGPKPQSVEAAIVMICDAVEAASRSLEVPTREGIENMVRILIIKRITDGQFDECRLTTGSLARILRVLVDSLEASFHSRVVYPWQEKQKEKIQEVIKVASA